MKRLGISVEGATEREFVNRLLRPHLTSFDVEATAIDIKGNVSLDKIRGILPALLGSFDTVSTLYDFYGFKGRGQLKIYELETEIHELIDLDRRPRLIPYIQQYEFEALLFAAPEQSVQWLGGSTAQLNEMQLAVKRAGEPELVNDSVSTSPSHRMQKIFSSYSKKLHGSEIIKIAGLNHIRTQCPRFHSWIEKLETL
jgi:hypothetical protein